MAYTTRHAAALYNVSTETIRLWTIEFKQYLSPRAQPGKNKYRSYSVEDMEVLSLVAELKRQGLNFADIHVTLQSGQRGTPPDLPPAEVQQITSVDQERRLSLEVDYLQRALIQTKAELEETRALAEQVTQTREENIRLKSNLEYTERELTDTQERLERTTEQLLKRIEDLSLQVGREYAKGFVEGLRERPAPPAAD